MRAKAGRREGERERESARERERVPVVNPKKKNRKSSSWRTNGRLMEISRPVVCVEFFLTHFFGLFASGSVCAYKFIRVMSMSMCTHTCVCMHVCLCMCDCACVFHTHTCTHTHIQYRQPDLGAQVQRGGVGCSVQVRNRAQLDDLRGLRMWLHR